MRPFFPPFFIPANMSTHLRGMVFLIQMVLEAVRISIWHYRNIYLNRPDPIAFLLLAVHTSDRLYDDFLRLIFFNDHRETSLANELTEESDQWWFLHAVCLDNLKGSVGLIMTKAPVVRISIPLDLSSRSFIPLPCFIRSRWPTPLLAPSLVLFPPSSAWETHADCLFQRLSGSFAHHSLSVTFFSLVPRLFLFWCK